MRNAIRNKFAKHFYPLTDNDYLLSNADMLKGKQSIDWNIGEAYYLNAMNVLQWNELRREVQEALTLMRQRV